jgi:hypothetical protein
MELGHAWNRELTEGTSHPAKLRGGAGSIPGTGGDGQAKVDLKEVAAQLIHGGLEIIFAVMSAGRGGRGCWTGSMSI